MFIFYLPNQNAISETFVCFAKSSAPNTMPAQRRHSIHIRKMNELFSLLFGSPSLLRRRIPQFLLILVPTFHLKSG